MVLSGPTPLIRNAEIARRVLSPLALADLRQRMARSGQVLAEQPIDLADERYTVYVPPPPPGGRYGLLVFIAPWDEGGVPSGWKAALDRFGLIYVSAEKAGNDADILGRRMPLAVAAAQVLLARGGIDPDRVWVAGFSGGSRMALRVAVAYPDIFRGALLNSGSDAVGQETFSPPPAELAERLRALRLVYVTGARDDINLDMDAQSRASLQRLCVLDAVVQSMPAAGHEVANGAAFEAAVRTLSKKRPGPQPAACVRKLDGEIAAATARAKALDGRALERALRDIDRRYGGLADVGAPAQSQGHTSLSLGSHATP